MKTIRIKILAGVACLALSACATSPAEHATLAAGIAQVAPAVWSDPGPAQASGGPADATPGEVEKANAWWAGFGDPLMRQLVATVLTDNLDLQAALERVKQAEAVTDQRGAALLPQLDATALAADSRQNTPPPLGYVRQAGVGLAASWDPDVFGGQRLEVLAAQAQVTGRRQEIEQLRLALAASTAAAYIDLRWAQAELKILQDNAGIRQRALRLTQQRREFGLSTTLDVSRATNQLAELQAQVPRVEATIQHQLSLLALYSGRAPETTNALLAASGPLPQSTTPVPTWLPSQVLLRRPDIRVAYAKVEARAAEVGVARAQRYPQFTLRLTDGLLASSYLGLPTLADNLFSAALSATSPIFNAGRIKAGIAGRESQMREADLGLRQTMLSALKDVEDSRRDLVSSGQQVEQLGMALSASNQALRLSTELYKGGASSFLDVLAAQESYLKDADALNQAKRAQALSAVALYRAMGGGWSGAHEATADETVSARADDTLARAGAQPAPQAN